jgi:hypothetical protein
MYITHATGCLRCLSHTSLHGEIGEKTMTIPAPSCAFLVSRRVRPDGGVGESKNGMVRDGRRSGYGTADGWAEGRTRGGDAKCTRSCARV